VIQTYVFWNLHEPQIGQVSFSFSYLSLYIITLNDALAVRSNKMKMTTFKFSSLRVRRVWYLSKVFTE